MAVKIIIVCQLLAVPLGNHWQTGAAMWRYDGAPKCVSENDVIPEELQADDETTKSLAAKIDELVKKMEAP